MEYERARQTEVEDISSKKKYNVKGSLLEFWNWTRRCKCLQLLQKFEKSNSLSSTLPESRASGINFGLFEMSKKKKVHTTKTQ